jgi:hypothetical protein
VKKRRPEIGRKIRTLGERPSDEHICTIVSMLSVQFVASYEVAREDGGWVERTVFLFFKDEGVTWKMLD